MADELPDRLWVVTHGRFREAHFYKDLAEQVAAHFTSSPASITEFVDASRLTAAQEQVERLRDEQGRNVGIIQTHEQTIINLRAALLRAHDCITKLLERAPVRDADETLSEIVACLAAKESKG